MVQTFKHVRDSDLPGSTEYLVMLTPMDQTCDKFRPGGDLAYSKVIIIFVRITSRRPSIAIRSGLSHYQYSPVDLVMRVGFLL